MKIYCPQCHTCYNIEVGLIPADGKKLRCNKCGEVWLCTHKDMSVEDSPNVEETTSKDKAPQTVIANPDDKIIATTDVQDAPSSPEEKNDDDMSKIFARLETETSKINEEIEHLSPRKKIYSKVKKLLGWDSRITICIETLITLIIILLSLFANRYELAHRFPQTEAFFNKFGLPAHIIGEGLEFQNITRHYTDKPTNQKLTIQGFIHNSTNKNLSIPTILINTFDSKGENLQQIKKEMPIKNISSKSKIPFTFKIEIPEHQAKYILLTFTE